MGKEKKKKREVKISIVLLILSSQQGAEHLAALYSMCAIGQYLISRREITFEEMASELGTFTALLIMFKKTWESTLESPSTQSSGTFEA
tara:strand:- start:1230 stop:1496 length:267 start_codon:yes stop_codon:yes gene_type:complete